MIPTESNHGASGGGLINLPPLRIPTGPAEMERSDNPKTPIERVDGLQEALRRMGGSDAESPDLTALTARVAALEALLSGYGHQSLSVCIGGAASSRTFLTK